MKPRNFPARKKARQIAADIRNNTSFCTSCRENGVVNSSEVQAARSIRTKKNRG